ncbi:MAG: hypothetical protein ACAH83_19355 [Alphaproteobacteria bacterium]
MPSNIKIDYTAALREELRHVCWIGGGSGAGKSTIARRIAAQHGLRLYATDDVMADHVGRSTAKDCPFLNKFMKMDMDERWVNRTPQTMLETFHWFRGEAFNMIVEDLLRLPKEPAVIAEGFRLLPRFVHPLLAASFSRAVWLLPTPGFSQAAFKSRADRALEFLAKTSDPEKARSNLLERGRLFTERCREETKRLNLPAIEVDTTMSEDCLTGRVAEALGLQSTS